MISRKPQKPNIEINLSGKLIRLVAKGAKNDQKTAELLEMLEGVYVRGYHSINTDLDEVSRYYKNKLKEGWGSHRQSQGR